VRRCQPSLLLTQHWEVSQVRRWTLLLATVFLAALAAVALVVPTASAVTSCPVGWGSLEKQAPGMSVAPIVGVRAGQQDCYDRLVFDIAGRAPGYDVKYVSQVLGEASGLPVNVPGGARLAIVLRSPAYNAQGQSTIGRMPNVSGFKTFRSVVYAGSFEGQTTIGLGVRARLPFRVFVLPGPGTGSRVVVDVADRWTA